MKKYFSFAKADNAFIVSADSREELTEKIIAIGKKHPAYYHKHVESGYYVVQAASLGEAKKSGEKELAFDLPLFRSEPPKYRVFTWDDSEDEALLMDEFPGLREALHSFEGNIPEKVKIVLINAEDDSLKTLYREDIVKAIEAMDRDDRRNRRQMTLF